MITTIAILANYYFFTEQTLIKKHETSMITKFNTHESDYYYMFHLTFKNKL